MYDTGPIAWVGQNVEYVFTMIESTSRLIFPRINWNGSNGMTRAVPQTSHALDSGATIHFFGNQDLLQSIKEIDKSMKINCGGTTFNQAMVVDYDTN